MKKYILHFFLFALAAATSFTVLSCDKFDTLPLNVPMSVEIISQGSNLTIGESETFCLNNDETFQKNREKLKQVTFVEAAWRTKSVSANLQGTIELTLQDQNGNLLFNKTLPGADPAAYMSPNKPYILTLSANEIGLINSYLDQIFSQGNGSFCFEATATITVTSGSTPYLVDGYVDVVFETVINF
jgi:hypothetical protein